MNVFRFNPVNFSNQFAMSGFVHIKNGVNPEFLHYAKETANKLVEKDKQLKEWRIEGKKLQYLMEFPKSTDFPNELFDVVSEVTGLERNNFTICERHIKVYEDVADNNPPPHKDRLASQVTVGIPLEVPKDSYLILYPEDHLTINPFNTSALWRTSLDTENLPENILRNIEPVKVDVQPGDVVMFRGSSIYHERVNPAYTKLLYLKFNAMKLDPLAEDPKTIQTREKSLSLLKQKSDHELLNIKVDVSPKLEKISKHYTRLYWKEVIQAYVNGEKEITLSNDEYRIIKNCNGERSIKKEIEHLGVHNNQLTSHISIFRRLIKLGVLELID
jgi:hypothetical protein